MAWRGAGKRLGVSLVTAAWMLATPPSSIAEQPGPDPESVDAPHEPASESDDRVSVTRHAVVIDGVEHRYTATAGYMTLPDYEGEPRADVFFVAYTLDGVEDPSERPLTFSFNGGPGSSSVWLHMGTLGPKRVDMGPEGLDDTPPFTLSENPHSWLDLTDMVFIDPVSTGYSRPVDDVSAKEFHGLREDISSVGDFIRLWTTRHERWASPKFLIGESYGTTRAAGLSGYLQDTHGMFLTGISLVSPVLNFQTIRFNVGNDQPFWLFLPTYTATAYYHGMLDADLSRDLERTLDEVRRWAQTDYLVALAKGDRLQGPERERIATTLARYTGLSREYVQDADLRINIFGFTKELLRDRGRTVGRLDSRFTGFDRLDTGDSFEYDPSYSAILGTYGAAINDYLRRELGYESDHPYEILTGRVRPWSYSRDENRYVNVAETLRSAMSRNPSLEVFVACGYYDLATPFFAAEYTVDHLGLAEPLRDNVMLRYYHAGHMMYLREADLAKLKGDAREFYESALDRATE